MQLLCKAQQLQRVMPVAASTGPQPLFRVATCDIVRSIPKQAASAANASGKPLTAAGLEYCSADEATKTSLKVIADHIRAVVYLVSDGVIPSNVGRGYVARRLLRRVVLKCRLLGISKPFVSAVADVAVALSPGCDPQVAKGRERVIAEIAREEERFLGTIAAGQSMLDKVLERAEGAGGVVAGSDVFMLYDTYGFPLELTQEVAEGRNLKVDSTGFQAAMEEQRLRSKVCSLYPSGQTAWPAHAGTTLW